MCLSLPPSLALITPWNRGITVYHQSSTNKDPAVIEERKLTVKEVLNLAKHDRDAVGRIQTFRWKEGGTEWNQSWVGAVRYSNGLSNFISQKSSAWVWWLVRQSQTTETCNFLPDSKRLPIFIEFWVEVHQLNISRIFFYKILKNIEDLHSGYLSHVCMAQFAFTGQFCVLVMFVCALGKYSQWTSAWLGGKAGSSIMSFMFFKEPVGLCEYALQRVVTEAVKHQPGVQTSSPDISTNASLVKHKVWAKFRG